MTSPTQRLSIAELSAATGVSAHTLRYYERAGLILPVARNSSNHRRYSTDDVAWVEFLLRLRETGMSISRMREYADLRALGPQTTQARLDLLQEHADALRDQLARLKAHQAALERKINTYQDQLADQPAAPRSGDEND